MTIVIGTGHRAARVLFGRDDDAVEIRQGIRIISGNADLATALRWVLEHPGAALPAPGIELGDLRDVLRSLERQGIPPLFWGPAWAQLCREPEPAS